jgi:hypothetical protein
MTQSFYRNTKWETKYQSQSHEADASAEHKALKMNPIQFF